MTTMQLPSDLDDRYELLADRLDGFGDADELAAYVLESTADEIERGDAPDGGAAGASADSADADVVEDRLEQLGYLEK